MQCIYSPAVLISWAQNASSLAIEQELVTHPDVLEAAVVARAHPRWGERPMAFITLHPSKAARWEGKHKEFEADLKAHARKKLPGFATPEWVSVVPELPVSGGGRERFAKALIPLVRKPRPGRFKKLNCARGLPSCELTTCFESQTRVRRFSKGGLRAEMRNVELLPNRSHVGVTCARWYPLFSVVCGWGRELSKQWNPTTTSKNRRRK